MKQTVQLRVVNPKVEDTNPATGAMRRKQDIVVAWNEDKPNGQRQEHLVSICLYDEQQEMFEHCQYKVGDELEMDFTFRTNIGSNGRVYNSIRASIFNN